MILTTTPPNPSVGNHIPLSTDCPITTIEATPPIDFSEQTEPSKIPSTIKKTAGIKLIKIQPIMDTENIVESTTTPTAKNRIDCKIAIGRTAKIYENMPSRQVSLLTIRIVS